MMFFKWLVDRVFKHMYWYKEPPKIWRSEKWGKVHSATSASGSPFVYKMPGNPVTKKKCKVCQRTVWSNNKKSICGSLQCWLKGEV